jgi:hypothetical protein
MSVARKGSIRSVAYSIAADESWVEENELIKRIKQLEAVGITESKLAGYLVDKEGVEDKLISRDPTESKKMQKKVDDVGAVLEIGLI